MVKYQLSFHANIVGPYGLFSGPSGQFTVGREVDTSSQSSEVSEFISKASRFSSWSAYSRNIDLGEVEYAKVQEIDFNYDGDVDEPMYIVAAKVHAVINVFGGWRALYSEVIKVFGGWNAFYSEVTKDDSSFAICYDEDGIDYERLVEYAVKLKLVGGEAERLMKLEGISLW